MSLTDHTLNDANYKRRKLRKGTFSCWECKHRKRKCEFGPVSSSICVYCQHRGLPCVGQEIVESSTAAYKAVERRVEDVEEMVHKLIRERGKLAQRESDQRPLRLLHFDPMRISSLRAVSHERLSRGPSLTGYLYSVLPAPHIILLILKSSKQRDAPLQILRSSHEQTNSLWTEESLIPDCILSVHPITFAHRLIRLAICLREMNDSASNRARLGLEEAVVSTARRCYEAASRFVMSQDYLVGSLDGLETLLLQSRYHISVGELHTARLIYRRASHIAHLMKLHQQAGFSGPRADSLVFQILYGNCFMSLMLGQSFSAIDYPSITQDESSSIGSPRDLERIHVRFSERIIARNVRIQNFCKHGNLGEGGAFQDHEETKNLDCDLKKAARGLPTTWWISCSIEDTESDASIMSRTANLLLQTHQYYLLVLVHQPYLLQLMHWDSFQTQQHSIDQTYSTMVSVLASREVLSRYLMLRKFHKSLTYRGLDDKAFAAALSLLLSHLNGHSLESANVLEHQRPQDLGTIDCVIKCIEDLSHLNGDTQGPDRAKLLRQFVQVEADAIEGDKYSICHNMASDDTRMHHSAGGGCHLEFDVPYFGTMYIMSQTTARSDHNVPSFTISVSDITPRI